MKQSILQNLIIYRNLLNDPVIKNYENLYLTYLNYNNLELKEEYLNKYYDLCSILIYNNYDSINDYIIEKILFDENIFSLSSEKSYEIGDKIKSAVFHDLKIIKKVLELPVQSMALNANDTNNFINYKNNEELAKIFNKKSIEEIYRYICNEYRINGSGLYRNNYAFSLDENGQILPVDNFNPVHMENIYEYENQKNKIICNTKRFVEEKDALNVLLVGDSGTGKSTTVKALIPMFKHNKLRIIEVDKNNLYKIPNAIEMLKNRGMYFIIFIDDLSFESNESSYRYLKSVVEGSIYEQPKNILFYVTSNRKHLIKENMSDRVNEVHLRDAINEQTSLADRFGLTVLYGEPNQAEYFKIVKGLAKKYNIKYSNEEEFLLGSKMFAMQNSGRTGRSALQFIKTFELQV